MGYLWNLCIVDVVNEDEVGRIVVRKMIHKNELPVEVWKLFGDLAVNFI